GTIKDSLLKNNLLKLEYKIFEDK
ncbi:hypothetical protein LCGC14_2941960, partial [marine sediment metagenome]